MTDKKVQSGSTAVRVIMQSTYGKRGILSYVGLDSF